VKYISVIFATLILSTSSFAADSLNNPGIQRRISTAKQNLEEKLRSCTDSRDFFLISLRKKENSKTLFNYVKTSSVTPIEALLSAGEHNFSFPLDVGTDLELKNTIMNELLTIKSDIDSTPVGTVKQELHWANQSKLYIDKEISLQSRSDEPLLNGLFVQASCEQLSSFIALAGDLILAIEPSSDFRRGYAVPLELYEEFKE